jgi:hypothetical protein
MKAMSAEASLRPMTPDKACSLCGEFKHGDPCDDLECPRRGRNPPVMVPRAALEFVMDILRSYDDEGPRGEGWQSQELEAAVQALDAALAKEESE